MKNGLYIVDTNNIYAAFVVANGEITSCAPILRARIDFYKRIARWVPTRESPVEDNNDADDAEVFPPAWHVGCV